MKTNVFAIIRIAQWHCQIQRRRLSPFVMRAVNTDNDTCSERS